MPAQCQLSEAGCRYHLLILTPTSCVLAGRADPTASKKSSDQPHLSCPLVCVCRIPDHDEMVPFLPVIFVHFARVWLEQGKVWGLIKWVWRGRAVCWHCENCGVTQGWGERREELKAQQFCLYCNFYWVWKNEFLHLIYTVDLTKSHFERGL